MQLQQKEIDNLRDQLENLKSESYAKEKNIQDKLFFWENQYKIVQQECKELKDKNEDMSLKIKTVEERCQKLDKSWQSAESLLVDATAEVKVFETFFNTFFFFWSLLCSVFRSQKNKRGQARKDATN